MEVEMQSKKTGGILPILDMKSWTDQEGRIIFQHYDKYVDGRKELRSIYIPKEWQKEVRKKKKVGSKHDLAAKGGHIAPIFVSALPGGELAKQMKKLGREKERENIPLKIVEMRGNTLWCPCRLQNAP